MDAFKLTFYLHNSQETPTFIIFTNDSEYIEDLFDVRNGDYHIEPMDGAEAITECEE